LEEYIGTVFRAEKCAKQETSINQVRSSASSTLNDPSKSSSNLSGQHAFVSQKVKIFMKIILKAGTSMKMQWYVASA
jgi:hypothetical protein